MNAGERLAIGEDRWLIPVETPELDDPVRIVGFQEYHPRPDTGAPCSGFVWVDATSDAYIEGSPLWTVVSWEPLTLTPSILCRACANHGFVTNGKWMPA